MICLMIPTLPLVRQRFAPAWIIFSASVSVRMPPAAFTPIFSPTVVLLDCCFTDRAYAWVLTGLAAPQKKARGWVKSRDILRDILIDSLRGF
jgi:hypothetical protein